MVFNKDDGQNDVELSYALTPQGMIDTAGGKQNYHYYLTDQLGSLRVIFCDLDGNGRVDIHDATSEACLVSDEACLASGKMLQMNNFYPGVYPEGFSFRGMQHVDWDISDDNPYMFEPKRSGDPGLVPGGKEMKEHTLSGALLAWYDFGARQYDPVLGRWHARDPANQFASPYVAMGNDPVNSTDPTGLFATRMEEYYDPPNNRWNNNALTYPGSGSESSGSSYANDYIDPYGRSLAEEHLAAIDEWMEMTGHGLSVYCGYSSLWEMKVSQASGEYFGSSSLFCNPENPILSGYHNFWLAGSAQFRAVVKLKNDLEEAYELHYKYYNKQENATEGGKASSGERMFFIVVKHGSKERGDPGGNYNGHVFLLIGGIDYSFRPGNTRNGEPLKVNSNNNLWHSDGWIGSNRDYLGFTMSVDHSVYKITTSESAYNALVSNIRSSMLNPPDYRFFNYRCASWAMRMMRRSDVIPASSFFYGWSPKPFMRYFDNYENATKQK